MATPYGTTSGRRSGAPRGRRPEGRWRHTFAALDLGTNNCRLLVAQPSRGGFRVIDSFSRIVRLGQGLGASGVLADDAIERTIGALRICAGKMDRRRVTLSRTIATEACRQAANCDEFLARVTEQTGLNLDIIDAAEEARLAVAGPASVAVYRSPDGQRERLWSTWPYGERSEFRVSVGPWSPDGRWVVAAGVHGNRTGLFLLEVSRWLAP